MVEAGPQTDNTTVVPFHIAPNDTSPLCQDKSPSSLPPCFSRSCNASSTSSPILPLVFGIEENMIAYFRLRSLLLRYGPLNFSLKNPLRYGPLLHDAHLELPLLLLDECRTLLGIKDTFSAVDHRGAVSSR